MAAMRMKRSLVAPFALTCLLAAASVAPSAFAGDAAPSAEKIKSAAAEYDLAVRAYGDNKFEEAAIHFENAFRAAPDAQPLRNAIRTRRQAGQLARAATLAALALDRYASDEKTMTTAKETLADADPKLHRVTLSCDVPCEVAVDRKMVTVEEGFTKAKLYFEPGPHSLVVSWPGDRSKEVKIDGKPGTREDVSLTAPPMPEKPPENPPVAQTPPVTGPPPPPPSTKPFGPAVFGVMFGLTAVAGGVLIWSGVDTLNNPGADAVRTQCVGLGESCPAYKTGLASQLRTNVLIGVTGGLGLLTGVVGLFLTQWSSPKKDAEPSVSPAVSLTPSGGSVGLTGRF